MVRQNTLSKRVLVMKIGLKACFVCLFISTSIGATHSNGSGGLNNLQHFEDEGSQEHHLTQKGEPRKRRWKKNPVKSACDECRRRHVSCNEVLPGESCQKCKDKNTACTWNAKKQMESGKPCFSDDDDYVEEKERPRIFHHILDEKSNNSKKTHHNVSGKKSEPGVLLRHEARQAAARNSVAGTARSENGCKIYTHIKRDAPYSGGVHYPPHTVARKPLDGAPGQTTHNMQHASFSLGQCPRCYYQCQANQQNFYLGDQLSENSAAFFSANNSGYQNVPPYCVYGEAPLNQYPPQGSQAFYETDVQHSGMPFNPTAAYQQAFNDGYEDYGNHEVYENDWQ